MTVDLTPTEAAALKFREELSRARAQWQSDLKAKPKEFARLASSPELSKEERKKARILRKLAKHQLRENRWLASRTRRP